MAAGAGLARRAGVDVSSDEPREPPTADPYHDLLGELVVAYAEHRAMQGRIAAPSAELARYIVNCRSSTPNSMWPDGPPRR
jgi:hypothetical protein